MQAEVEPAAVPLWGTAWRLESLAGAGVAGRAQATLEFPSEGRASGNGFCNRFNGVVTVEGDTIQFGGIAATRKACADAVMRQEDSYFAALRDAERFAVDGESLRIYTAGREEPLRFVAAAAPAGRPAQGIQSVPATETPALTGIWTVVAHHIPGVSAMGDGEARTHYGETVRLTESSAISPGASCREPRYASNRVSAQQYLASEYKLQPGSLQPLAAQGQIQLMKVSCGGAPWNALGATLLGIDKDRVLAPWDGIFFELVRDRDFRAVGQEPGWHLEIRKGSEMRFTYDYSKGTAVTPASRAKVDSNTGTRTYHATSGANDLRVEIVPVSCADSMSGRPFPATVSVTLNGKTFRGCGEELATPFQG
jgi:heat shock protein HslJ